MSAPHGRRRRPPCHLGAPPAAPHTPNQCPFHSMMPSYRSTASSTFACKSELKKALTDPQPRGAAPTLPSAAPPRATLGRRRRRPTVGALRHGVAVTVGPGCPEALRRTVPQVRARLSVASVPHARPTLPSAAPPRATLGRRRRRHAACRPQAARPQQPRCCQPTQPGPVLMLMMMMNLTCWPWPCTGLPSATAHRPMACPWPLCHLLPCLGRRPVTDHHSY